MKQEKIPEFWSRALKGPTGEMRIDNSMVIFEPLIRSKLLTMGWWKFCVGTLCYSLRVGGSVFLLVLPFPVLGFLTNDDFKLDDAFTLVFQLCSVGLLVGAFAFVFANKTVAFLGETVEISEYMKKRRRISYSDIHQIVVGPEVQGCHVCHIEQQEGRWAEFVIKNKPINRKLLLQLAKEMTVRYSSP